MRDWRVMPSSLVQAVKRRLENSPSMKSSDRLPMRSPSVDTPQLSRASSTTPTAMPGRSIVKVSSSTADAVPPSSRS